MSTSYKFSVLRAHPAPVTDVPVLVRLVGDWRGLILMLLGLLGRGMRVQNGRMRLDWNATRYWDLIGM